MAMMNCPECGKDISDKAASCPHCGNPLNQKPQAKPGDKKCLSCGYVGPMKTWLRYKTNRHIECGPGAKGANN